MNKCDPLYCEGLTRGHIFWCRTFLSKISFNFIGGWPGWSGWSGGTGGMGGIVLRVYEFEMYYGFYVFMCFLSQQEEQQQQYTSLLLTGLLTGVSR